MEQSPERLAYKSAVAAKDWQEAARLVRARPDIFGTPPDGVPDEIAAIANDPLEPVYMIVEWTVQKNECKGNPGCRPYLLTANQFDHLAAGRTPQEVEEWFQKYVKNRLDHLPSKGQLGQTLYLLKVERIAPISGFHGEKI